MFLGINEEEKKHVQDVIIHIRIYYIKHAEILCYQNIINEILEKYNNYRIDFVEDLADEIACLCLIKENVNKVFVKIEKSANSIFTKSNSVGVEITREN